MTLSAPSTSVNSCCSSASMKYIVVVVCCDFPCINMNNPVVWLPY
jgi:hypothetical protein